jgi:ferric-dicitrate binding protein FerR (iron transport regulator)
LLLLLSIGGYMHYTRPATKIAAVKLVADILPGSDKAVLTLGNGATVMLDSTGNQVITQGTVQIRQQNGQLHYATANGTTEMVYNTLTTPRGGKFRIVLPDGSAVWLNAASSLTFPTAFNGNSRVVELRGQGYFEIAPDAKRPFKVKVKDMEVQVLGTSFDIMAYTEETAINTTLVQGGVRVVKGNNTQLLQPGQQAVIAAGSQQITVQEANVNQVIAWKNDRFIFNDTDLETILREVARWYDVQIVYTKKPGNEKYNGGLSRHLPLSVVLQLLEDNGNNHFKTDGQKIIVSP